MDLKTETPPPPTQHRHLITATPSPPSTVAVSYKECLRNHAASLGAHALDGCGEFMPSAEPRSQLTCAACGCHRNFHRRDTKQQYSNPTFISFYPSISTSPSSSPSRSPPPLSHHFPPSHHHLHSQISKSAPPHVQLALGTENPSKKKRCRTKFSEEQKGKMLEFSEKLGWRMQREEEGSIQKFCDGIGVSREVFKVWMHNNKSRSSSEIGNEKKINGGGYGFQLLSDINNPHSRNSSTD
ncbi:zinc-finger homeodomain protein 6-like [Lotus japonicus]|uniref:zinc-finger homeodomain protein 6-like n=1 Tax=Lotus japonicus TaxID=34305 RepID=UPI00258A6EC0|nr:zinc-finger homeodomain protein 6-like [Lotus japonicus]